MATLPVCGRQPPLIHGRPGLAGAAHQHPEGVQRARYRDRPLSLSAATAQRDHEALYEAGLIHSVEHKAKLLFALTERGRRVAEQLAEINRIMAGGDTAPPG